jgi:hypothetical protein
MNAVAKATLEILKQLHRGSVSISFADLDRIDVMIEIDPESFPASFVELAKRHDRSSATGRQALVERLLAQIETHMQFMSLAESPLSAEQLLPMFELDEDEKQRIAHLCEQLRKIVHASTDFDQPHKVRLLNRIAAIEAEAQKPKGKFDVFLGGMSDFGETLGKFGTDSKPIVDRITEIVRIGRNKTKDYDQLPAPEETKQLPPPQEEDGGTSK